MGYGDTVRACLTLCRNSRGCKFFLYDSNDGECIKEDTTTENCDFEPSSYYNFYKDAGIMSTDSTSESGGGYNLIANEM